MPELNRPPRGNPLGSAPIPALIRRFAIPAVVSFLVNSAYNITDQIFIGRTVGILGNAATNVAFPLMTLTIALSQLAGVGTAAAFNLHMGAGEREEAERFIGTGLTLSVLIGLVLGAVVLLFQTPILLLCGATEAVLPFARSYLGITGFGLPLLLFINASNMMIRADGSPNYSMLSTVVGAVLNIFLDALFMLVFRWGIQGAAAATVIGQTVSCLMCLAYLPRFRAFPIRRGMLGLRPACVRRIARLGFSNLLNLTMLALMNVVLNNTLTHYGAQSVYGSDIPLAVAGIVSKINSILMAFTVGLAHGCQPIFSFNMGAKNYARIKEAYKKAALAALCFSFLAFLCFQLFPRQITGVFGTGEELYYQFSTQYLRIFMMLICLVGIQPLTVNYFTSIGDVPRAIFLSLGRQGLFLIPLLLILPLFFGLNGALAAGPTAELLSFLLSVTMIFFSFRKLTRLEETERVKKQS